MKKISVLMALLFLFLIIALSAPDNNPEADLDADKNKVNTNTKVHQDMRYRQDSMLSKEQPAKSVNKNILILGIDSRKGEPSRADVIILLSVKKEKIIFISIPRDSQIFIKNKKRIKVNATYIYGGIELSKKAIEKMLDIKIDNHVVLNFNAIKNGVDALGGFTVTIPKDIKVSDTELKKKFIIKKGTHTLNGIQTLEYLRYRNDGKGDIARIYRQQQFIKDIQNSFLCLDNIPLIPRAYMAIRDDIETDMEASDMAAYFLQGYRLKDNFEYYTLEGHVKMIDKVSYLILEENSIENAKKILDI